MSATSIEEIEITGEVVEADVKSKRFQIALSADRRLTVIFTDDQEAHVTTALRGHRTIHLRLKAHGEVSDDGEVLRIHQVEEMAIVPSPTFSHNPAARSIGEVFDEIAAEIPQEEWDKVPCDLSENLDQYLYGTPKQ